MASVCHEHNVSKIADSDWARKVLIVSRVRLYGTGPVKSALDSIPWQERQPDMTLEGILAAPDPPIKRDMYING